MSFLSGCLFKRLNNLTSLFKPRSLSLKTLQTTANSYSSNINGCNESTIKLNVFKNINNTLPAFNTDRLFAVVHLCGKQFKVTSGDIIIIEGYWPPTTNDRIRLEKVLLVGGNNFTLCGRPILEPGLVDIQATVIEKTLSHTKTHFKKKRRKQYLRINFQRSPHTMLRITSIDLPAGINETKNNLKDSQIF